MKALQSLTTATATALLSLACASTAVAGEEAAMSPSLTERLAESGVDLKMGYTSEDFRNVGSSGPSAGAHAGQLSVSTAFDLEKLWGISNAALHLDVSYRDGKNLQDRGVVTLLQPQEIHGRGQTWRLSGLWFGKQFLEGRMSLKAGRMTVGGEFGDLECTFVNQGLCGTQPGNINGDYWFNWPISQWAMTGQMQLPKDTSIKLGTYQVNPSLLERGHRFTLNPSGTVGVLVPVEFAWAPQWDGKRSSYKIGGWYTNAPVRDIRGADASRLDGSTLADRMRASAHGAYLVAEQQLISTAGGDAESGLRGFASITVSDRRTSSIDRTFALGAIYRGLSSARPSDEVGAGISMAHVNGLLQREQARRLRNGGRELPPDTSEYTLEVFYAWQATPWLRFQPDVQWIRHSGHGAANRDDYLVAGMKTVIQF